MKACFFSGPVQEQRRNHREAAWLGYLGAALVLLIGGFWFLDRRRTNRRLMDMESACRRLFQGDYGSRMGAVSLAGRWSAASKALDALADKLQMQDEEARRARHAHEQSETRYRHLVEMMPDAVFVHDAQGIILFVNAAGIGILGASEEAEVLERSVLDFLVPEDHERVKQIQKSGRAARKLELTVIRSDGGKVMVEAVSSPFLYEGVDARQVVLRDVGDRKQLDRERTLLSRALEQSSDAFLMTDGAGLIIFANAAFERLSGYKASELVGKKADILKSAEDDDAFYENLVETLQRGDVWRGNVVSRQKGGRLVEVSADVYPVRESEGMLPHYVAVCRDVTRERQLQDHLAESQRMESIGQLAGGIAHDFNNILVAIMGSVEFALKTLPARAPERNELEVIARMADKAAALTRALLAFARRQVIEPVDLNLNQVIREFLPLLERIIPENITVDFIEGHELGTIRADRRQVEQVLMNLCINGRDALSHGGLITIETENVVINGSYLKSHPWARPGRYVLLSVSDSGVGMPKDVLPHVFEPFFSTKAPDVGSGLGLSTAYGIIQQHEGMIRAYSEAGEGTTIKVYLPIVSRRAARVGTKIEPPVMPGHETILVVEDEREVRMVLVEALLRLGYRVLEAENGADALAHLKEDAEEVDLVITDVIMPMMGGKELFESVRAMGRPCRFLFSSGYTENLVHEGFVKKENFDFLPKPYGIDALARKVREVLDRPPGEDR
jgi:two-component system, cell cycle sensor histidine kinase and response regulator CckA